MSRLRINHLEGKCLVVRIDLIIIVTQNRLETDRINKPSRLSRKKLARRTGASLTLITWQGCSLSVALLYILW